ncbi:MAG: nifR3 family TIM-barrel protein [Promethearchaeota archaeon CR_4]|nr:MAG: nifR3 family TIM-barrel protein [Candidatus Lokiarchaeota archaeon CR_4]
MPKLGSFDLRHGLVLAPILDVTTSPFRKLCFKYGADMAFEPMVWTNYILMATQKFLDSVVTRPEEHPLGFQLITTRPEQVKPALDVLESLPYDLYDLNVGCPSRNVTKLGAGGALLGNLPLLEEIVAEMAKHAVKPFSLKIRVGLSTSDALLPVLQLAKDHGADFVTIHARTVSQGYGGTADWSLIHLAKNKFPDIPIVGNGDVRSPENARDLLDTFSCEGVMIGRTAMKNPRIFQSCAAFLEQKSLPSIAHREIFTDFLEFLQDTLADQKVRPFDLRAVRGTLQNFCSGFPLARRLRMEINNLTSTEELRAFATRMLDESDPIEINSPRPG